MISQSSDRTVLVVGASQAGVQFADRLRQVGYQGSVTLVGEEAHLPYQRPPLSKAWLQGSGRDELPELRSAEHYGAHGIELILGARVRELVRDGDLVTARWDDGAGTVRERTFDRVVLATGSTPRELPLPGAQHPDVLSLRGIEDARRLADRLPGPVVVIGGGFIGLEVAATARALGSEVTVVEAGPRLMGRAVGAGTADFLLAGHRAAGVEIVLGVAPVGIDSGPDGVRGVLLDDGTTLPATTVVVGIGVQPRTELAEQLGLECDNGIVVDQRCLTSDRVTLAIGDCTVQRAGSGRLIRHESVDNADQQAIIAADAVAGLDPADRPHPWFWSDQGEWKLQIVGDPTGHTDVVVRTDPGRPRRRVALYFGETGFLAAECVNSPADFVALRTALGRGIRPEIEAVADMSVPLRAALTAPAVTG